jgi:hypothetical protein
MLVRMHRVSRSKAAAAADFLFRYTVARYRCVGGQLSAGRIRLADEIWQGIEVFEGAIIIDADARLPIAMDREHYPFFDAIMNGCSEAVPEIEPAELAAWRNYVLNSGPVPKWREPIPTGRSPVSHRSLVEKSSIIAYVKRWLPRLLLSPEAERNAVL